MTDLSGTWTLFSADRATTVPLTLPGDAHTALAAAGVIPEPYFGRNEYACRWPADRDWTAERTFTLDDPDCDLIVEGLDCVAEITINDHVVLSAANAFRRWRVDASAALRAGENAIAIRFRSATRQANAAQAGQPFPVPYHAGNSPIPNGNMLRKQQCDFGWDWNIALAPFGVTGPIRLEKRVPLRIADLVIGQEHADGAARVTVDIHYAGHVAEEVPVSANLCGVTVSGTAFAHPGKGRHRLVLDIAQPELWWPAGLGAQTLHDLTVAFGPARAVRRIGLRALDLVSEPDRAGRSFGFRVNGRPVFARGANWIPADALAGRITREKTRSLLQSASDANMNMVRVWGGGRYEPDWFYDICDELGLMVWQDFMFSCNLYPADDAFLAEIRAEVTDVVRRLNHHACLALWCGDNELIGALTWFEESRANRDRYLVAYDRLNRTVEAALTAVMPGANWWPSSPSPGPMSFGDAWHDDTSGDMHFWSVWHEGRDFDHYRDIRPRFCSEFGFQSYPSMPVIRSFAQPGDMNIASPVMESHQKNAGGNARIAETMFRYFRFPESFADFVYLSQVQQGLAIKTAVTGWRALKPHCQGALYWQLNDTWPVCSWSSLDHGGGWKLLHHMARHFFAPVTVAAIPDGDGYALIASNDTAAATDISVTAVAVPMAGDPRPVGTFTASVGTEASTCVVHVPQDALVPGEVLAWHWTSGDGARGGDHLSPVPYKALDLPSANLTLHPERTGVGWSIRVETDALAFFVALEADSPGRFSDNAFLLFPGHPATIGFTPDDPAATPRFTARHLRSATYGGSN